MPQEKGIWKHLGNINVKIGIVVALFVGYESLQPYISGLLGFNDDIEAVEQRCKDYTDEVTSENKADADQWLDYFLYEISRINDRYTQDSLEHARTHEKFAVGVRSDLNGIMSYRSSKRQDCSIRLNRMVDPIAIEYYDVNREKWLPIFIEDRAL